MLKLIKGLPFLLFVISISLKCNFLEILGVQNATNYLSRQDNNHSWMNIPFLVTKNNEFSRNDVVKIFESCGIETRPIIAGNFVNHSAWKHVDTMTIASDFKNAELIHIQGFMIGCHPRPMTKDEYHAVQLVLEKIN